MTNDRIKSLVRARKLEGAVRFALANKSDPFAYRRAVAHIDSGLTSSRQDGEPADYNAEPYSEIRTLPSGTEYSVTAYRNVVRP